MIGNARLYNKKMGWKYLLLALISFIAILEELLIVYIEISIYGLTMNFKTWTIAQSLLHWTITCILWGVSAYFIVDYANKNMDFELKKDNKKIEFWKHIAIIFILCLTIFISYKNWNGLKIIREYNNLGMAKFIFQYIYYFFESVLFTLIIVFAQKGFEIIFRRPNINYGGIICGLTWGLGHILSKSNIEVGLLGLVYGFLFGSIYILLDRNLIKTFPIIFLMFIL